MSIKKIGVVGAGQMGNGIAHVAAQSGLDVLLHDVDEALVQKGLKTIDKNLQRGVDKGKFSAEDKKAVLGRIRTTTSLADFADRDLVVEAVVEKLDVKLEIFRELDRIVPSGRILATNTSSISITEIAAATERPERVIGMHFMNPVPVMKLVEIIRGLGTSDATASEDRSLAETLGKTPIECRDFPGFNETGPKFRRAWWPSTRRFCHPVCGH